MQTPIGICHEIHHAKPLMMTVKEPYSTTRNDKFGSEYRFFPRFGTSPALLGNLNLAGDLDYVLFLSNGDSSSANPCEEDDNEQKGLTGRVRYSPVNNLELCVSFYTDTMNEYDDETPCFRCEYLEPDTDTGDDKANRFIYGVNVRVGEAPFLKAELNSLRADEGTRGSRTATTTTTSSRPRRARDSSARADRRSVGSPKGGRKMRNMLVAVTAAALVAMVASLAPAEEPVQVTVGDANPSASISKDTISRSA